MRVFLLPLLCLCALACLSLAAASQPSIADLVGALGGGGGGGGKRTCSSTCIARQCDNFGIAYGNYCGVTHTGCSGVEPCDAYDSCCQAHDGCVTGMGLAASDVACHSELKRCLSAALAAKEKTFTTACAAKTIVKTMKDGMDLASAFAGGGGGGGGSGGRHNKKGRSRGGGEL